MSKKVISDRNGVLRLMKQLPFVDDKVISVLAKRNTSLLRLDRTLPPTRGVFIRLMSEKGPRFVESWVKTVKDKVLVAIKDQASIDHNYMSLLIMEKFQYNQKGPVAPIKPFQLPDEQIPAIYQASLADISDPAIIRQFAHIADIVAKSLKDVNFRGTIENINFKEWWSKLPSDSVRGLPVLSKGKFSDPMIMDYYGASFSEVFPKFQSIPFLVSTAGLRFQGSPPGDNAKVRLINIPYVGYQYMVNGIYKYSQQYLKHWAPLTAWLPPNERDAKITNMVKTLKSNGYSILPLDYRGYDRHLPPWLRYLAVKVSMSVFSLTSGVQSFLKHMEQLIYNQYLCVPWTKNKNKDKFWIISLLNVLYLLLSGISNTQQDGSIINVMLQVYIAIKLGYELPIHLCLALGDDTGLPIPNSIMEKLGGYDKTMEYIKKNILNPIGMDSHDKKAYPEPELLFLQRLYIPEKEIIAEYSLVRSIDSLVYAEDYRKAIDGIVNLNALDTISQITILNNAMEGRGKTTLKRFVPIVVREWLKIDDALCKLAKVALTAGNPESFLFNFLIKASGGKEAIVRALKLDQYDHTGTLAKLGEGDHGVTFPLIKLILDEAKLIRPKDVNIYDVYGTKTKIQSDGDKGIILV